MPRRIALGSIFTECNHFGGPAIDMDAFGRYELRRADEILACEGGAVGGAIEVLRAAGVTIAPTLVASACPGGLIPSDTYRVLKQDLLDRLQALLPVDGVLLPLHGSASAQDVDDVEGDLLVAVRKVVGPKTPVVATLDLHSHVTAEMVQNADALVAWESYPHRDAQRTGERGARMLLDIVEGRCKPAMAMAKVPVLVSGVLGHTDGPGPFADVMRLTKSYEARPGILSTSAFLVHPYLDVPGMGGGGLVITQDDRQLAESLAVEIARQYWLRRRDLEPTVYTPEQALEKARTVEAGPVLLVETADCCGGGAAGDGVAMLKVLLAARERELALVPVVDPQAARACHQAGVGGRVAFRLGHQVDPKWGTPVEVQGTVLRLSDGRFQYTGGIWGGTWAEMGPTAVLEVGKIQILIMSQPTYDWADEQFRAVDMHPAQARYVVVKNPMNHRFAYEGVARAALILNTPGPTPPTMRGTPYRRVARPYFPMDEEIPGLQPTVLRGWERPR